MDAKLERLADRVSARYAGQLYRTAAFGFIPRLFGWLGKTLERTIREKQFKDVIKRFVFIVQTLRRHGDKLVGFAESLEIMEVAQSGFAKGFKHYVDGIAAMGVPKTEAEVEVMRPSLETVEGAVVAMKKYVADACKKIDLMSRMLPTRLPAIRLGADEEHPALKETKRLIREHGGTIKDLANALVHVELLEQPTWEKLSDLLKKVETERDVKTAVGLIKDALAVAAEVMSAGKQYCAMMKPILGA